MHHHRERGHDGSRTYFYSFQLFLLILFNWAQETHCQKPTLFATTFDYNVSHRTNVCEQHAAYYRRDVELRDGLRNMTLRPGIGNWGSPFFSLDENGAIDDANPGEIVKILDELSIRAGFAWRNSYGLYEIPPEGYSWTDYVEWIAETYDLAADYWFRNNDRLARGLTFLPGWYDGSYIMVGEETVTTSSNLLSWLQPFDYRVWIMLVLTCLVSGVIYWGMNQLATPLDRKKNIDNPTDHFFLPALAVTGFFEFSPDTGSTMLLTASLAFFSVFLMSSYTANLASHFVVQNTPTLGIATIDDAVFRDLTICVWEGTPTEEFLRRKFPTYRNFLLYPNEEDMFRDSIGEDKVCRIAVTTVSGWSSYRNQRDVNLDCSLSWIGRVMMFTEASYILKSDSGSLCTSFIRDVLTVHMEEMISEGFFETMWTEHYRMTENQDCDAKSADRTDTDVENQITLEGIGGAFVSQLILASLAVLVSLFPLIRRKRNSTKIGYAGEGQESFCSEVSDVQELDVSERETQAQPQIAEEREQPRQNSMNG